MVLTPSDAIAKIVQVDERCQQALVQWHDGEQAHFRLKLLRPIRRPE